MSRALTYSVLGISVLSFFCLMSRIDFIVHNLLYNYGLQFSYEWANVYWATYSASFVVFSVIMGSTYWLASNKDSEHKRVALAIVATVNVLMIGGLQDIMYFVFWSGGLPPLNVTWWWVPWYIVFGTWDSFYQVGATGLSVVITAALWMHTIARNTIGRSTNHTRYLEGIIAENSQLFAEADDH